MLVSLPFLSETVFVHLVQQLFFQISRFLVIWEWHSLLVDGNIQICVENISILLILNVFR